MRSLGRTHGPKAHIDHSNGLTFGRHAHRSLGAPRRRVGASSSGRSSDAGMQQQQQQHQQPTTISGLREVAHLFDGVLLDQFGVLHDGRTPYPAAIEAVRQLAAAGKRTVIVSNSSRRAGGTIGKLEKMGFDGSWFAGAVTSGEMAHRFLAERPDAWWRRLGGRCLHLTWSSRGAISLDGLGLEVVASPGDADFILAHGTEAVGLPAAPGSAGGARGATLRELRELVEECAAEAARRGRAMPMVVANPDIVTVDGAGGLITMPGTLAEWYRAAGGEVVLMGKPAPLIYDACTCLAPGVAPGRWLAVGDSIQHDIAGAAAAGAGPAVLVVGGIHAEDAALRGTSNAAASWDGPALAALCREHGAAPAFAMAWMEW
ncbi:MAG: HAD-like domain-containing protein [Monoraphidium minutum]|nr:MAG: HAD-like domain-containing protein [Monoraphidium minutum]